LVNNEWSIRLWVHTALWLIMSSCYNACKTSPIYSFLFWFSNISCLKWPSFVNSLKEGCWASFAIF
jgi:hypothetical protein